MKKILLASSALIATAGVAAAELNVTGSARFGLAYVEDAANTGAEETRIEQRMRVNFTGIAETDAGVKFEARIRLEANEDANSAISGKGPGAAGFAVSTGGFRLDVGNVSDVFDSGDVVNFYGSNCVGFTCFLEYNAAVSGLSVGGFGAGGADATTIKAKYEVGDLTIAASYTDTKAQAATVTTDSNGDTTTTSAAVAENTEWMIGAGYSFGDYNVGLAYGKDDNIDSQVVATFSGSTGDFSYGVIINDTDGVDDLAYGLNAGYAVSSATSISFVFADGGNADDASYGLGFSHSLGGGVTLAGGVGSADDVTKADFGVKFKF